MVEAHDQLKSTKVLFEDEEEEKDWKQTVRIMNSLKVGIQNIFENIGCVNDHTKELVGTHGVSESNMMQYLGIIEMRTNEILQMYAACQNKGLDSQQAMNQQPINVAKEREKERVYIDAPDGNNAIAKMLFVVTNMEEGKRKEEQQLRGKKHKDSGREEDGEGEVAKLQQVEEKGGEGGEGEDLKMSAKEL